MAPPDQRVVCEYRLLHGEPADEIVKLADREQVEAIVIGMHDRSRLAHLLAGSTAEKLLSGHVEHRHGWRQHQRHRQRFRPRHNHRPERHDQHRRNVPRQRHVGLFGQHVELDDRLLQQHRRE